VSEGEGKLREKVIERESLVGLLRAASSDFSEPEQRQRIRRYVEELSYLMDPEPASSDDAGAARALATSNATGEDVLTLLCKLEDYLESLLVERLARS
jgi:hypothetical protein